MYMCIVYCSVYSVQYTQGPFRKHTVMLHVFIVQSIFFIIETTIFFSKNKTIKTKMKKFDSSSCHYFMLVY